MRIDSHQHFWKFDPVADSWITEDMKRIRSDFMPADLKLVLEQNKIDACIAVQARQSEAETNFLLKLADENDFIKGVVGWVNLQKPDVEGRLAHFSSYKKFKGVRHIVQGEPNGFMAQNSFQDGIKALKKFNLTYDILIYPHQLSDAIQLVNKFPNQHFVLDHMAKPAFSNGVDKDWEKQITELAKNENVFCKVSGLVTETKDFEWEYQNFTTFLNIVTNAFGIERLMFGSDWPVCLVAAEYSEVVKIVTDHFGEHQLTKIMGHNAKRFYNIN